MDPSKYTCHACGEHSFHSEYELINQRVYCGECAEEIQSGDVSSSVKNILDKNESLAKTIEKAHKSLVARQREKKN